MFMLCWAICQMCACAFSKLERKATVAHTVLIPTMVCSDLHPERKKPIFSLVENS